MKLLIVDDEPLIHTAIEYSLKEIAAQDVEVLHAYSGTDMLRRMEEAQFELVLVDIRMPGLSGLEAIQQANERWPNTMYYIMSGYSEFEYARQAVSLGVSEYLLKPLVPADLKRVLDRARQESLRRRQLTKDAFRGWLEGVIQRRDTAYLFQKDHYAALTLLVCDAYWEKERFWAPDFVPDHHDAILSLPCAEGVLLLTFSHSARKVSDIMKLMSGAQLPQGMTLFMTSVDHQPQRLSEQLYQLLAFAPARCFTGIERHYDAVALPAVSQEEQAQAIQWQALRNTLFEGQYSEYVALANALTAAWQGKGALPEPLSRYLAAVTGKELDPPVSLQQLQAALTAAGDALLQGQKNGDKLDAVLDYIREHYCEDVSISSLSGMFSLTPNYLSSLLKARTGVRFNDHLNALRLTKAKELLLTTNFSIREILVQVGYYSQSHFNKVFLDKEGCTPAEFRARHKR